MKILSAITTLRMSNEEEIELIPHRESLVVRNTTTGVAREYKWKPLYFHMAQDIWATFNIPLEQSLTNLLQSLHLIVV
jgi:hypothetical protein